MLINFRTRLDGHQQLDRFEHVRHPALFGAAVVHQGVLLADQTGPPLGRDQLGGAGVFGHFAALNAADAVHCFLVEQVQAGPAGWQCVPHHVRRVSHPGQPDRAERLLPGESAHVRAVRRWPQLKCSFVWTLNCFFGKPRLIFLSGREACGCCLLCAANFDAASSLPESVLSRSGWLQCEENDKKISRKNEEGKKVSTKKPKKLGGANAASATI